MADKEKKSSLKATDTAIIKIAIAIIFTIACYLGGNSLGTKTNEITQENQTLQKRVTKLENAAKNKNELDKKLKKMKADTSDILDKFPSNMTFEKVLEKVCSLWDERYAFGMTNISYMDNGVFYTFQDATGKEDETAGKISSVIVNVSYSTDLKTLTNMIDLINQEFETKTSIETINIEVSEDISAVEGEVSFTVYYGGNQRQYEEPKFDVDVGKKSIFN